MTVFEINARVVLAHDVDRFPHFVAPVGATGTVTHVGDQLCVRLDERAEAWENEIVWSVIDGDDPSEDLVLK